jgi:hypothetical protein
MDNNNSENALRLLKHIDSLVEWRLGRPDQQTDLLGVQNDLVVSCPPFGARVEHADASASRSGELASLPLPLSVQTLSTDGEALFVLTQGCWGNSSEGGWRTVLAASGFAIGACISIPSGTFAPFTSIPAVLVQVVRGRQGDLFIAELPDSAGQNQVLLENFTKHRSARDVLGDVCCHNGAMLHWCARAAVARLFADCWSPSFRSGKCRAVAWEVHPFFAAAPAIAARDRRGRGELANRVFGS